MATFFGVSIAALLLFASAPAPATACTLTAMALFYVDENKY
jgi:hypothetical protein